jgi:hypothetical protein
MFHIKKWLITCLFLIISLPACAEGKFILIIDHDGNIDHEQYATYVERKGTFKKIVEALNATLNIPYDIKIILASNEEGVLYDPKKKVISLDYGDLDLALEQATSFNVNKKSEQYYINNINLFNLYYMLGYALIDAYEINIGEENEDFAAIDLAIVMLLYYFPHGDIILRDASIYYQETSLAEGNENPYKDKKTIAYKLRCIILANFYAYQPDYEPTQREKNDPLFSFFEANRSSCLQKYIEMHKNWFTLLKPYFKHNRNATKAIEEINELSLEYSDEE